jgi:hypothetical protein
MGSDVSTYKKVRFGDDLLTDLQYIADCFGCPLQHLITKVLSAYRDGKSYPHPPEYEEMLKEREWAAKEAQREKHRQGHRQQSRLVRQEAIASSVIYRRPVGRPRTANSARVKLLRDFLALFGDQVKFPTTPQILGQMTHDWSIEKEPNVVEGRERAHLNIADVEPEWVSTADCWRELGNMQLLRVAPGEPDLVTLWYSDEAPDANVEIKPENDPWPGLITQTYASLRKP